MAGARAVFSATVVVALLLAACGKHGGLPNVAPDPGFYHLDGPEGVTALELRADGRFTLHRDSCETAGVLDCGAWRRAALTPTAEIVRREGLYWPTAPRFPSTVFRKLTLHGEESGDLVVIGESEWAGSFSQRWKRGRTCQVCKADFSSTGQPMALVATGAACTAPLPACSPP